MRPVSLDILGGEDPIARRLRTFTAGSSPLGSPDRWSNSLHSAVRMILPSQAEIVIFWGADYCALYNQAYAPTIGAKHPDALGQPARLFWAELWDDLHPLLASVRETGRTVHAKDRPFYIERNGGGETVYFDISYSPIPDDDGSVGGVLCIVSETTTRVLAQQRAIEDRERLWTLARDPFLIADVDGRWIAASPAWTDILGWTQQELVGRTSEWMEHPDDRSLTRGEVARVSQSGPTLSFENRFRDRAGNYHWFAWTAVREGDLLYCVARDVTAQKESALALEAAESALRQSQKMETLGQLTGGVAHDFNNLLQVVIGNVELLQHRLPSDDDRLRRAADNAMRGAQRAAVLTQRLLAFARRQPLQPTHIDVNRLIAGMTEMLHRTLGETIEVRTIAADALWLIDVDGNQLENALLNLAINARDAMPDGGTLTIETDNIHIAPGPSDHDGVAPGDYVRIRVTDIGEGMTPDTIARAFEPFFTTKEVGKGTGLGLSMVYGFIKQSDGHVRISSAPGRGSTIAIYLPHFVGEATADGPPVTMRARTDRGTETILVCEDDEDVRAYSAETLRALGYHVVEAGDAASALEVLGQEASAIDMLFTDVVLPGGVDGPALARTVLADHPGLPVLFATGYARNALTLRGRLETGIELLTKPFSATDLATKVRTLLDSTKRAEPAS